MSCHLIQTFMKQVLGNVTKRTSGELYNFSGASFIKINI